MVCNCCAVSQFFFLCKHRFATELAVSEPNEALESATVEELRIMQVGEFVKQRPERLIRIPGGQDAA
jgi:hypothetical protein